MNMLDLSDRIEAGSYRSDRFTAVPFTTLQDVMQQAQDALSTDAEDEGRWAGIVTPSCEDHTSWISVQREIGVGLRIGGEANLCFQCGPDGGHYHPSVSMDEVRATALRLNPLAKYAQPDEGSILAHCHCGLYAGHEALGVEHKRP